MAKVGEVLEKNINSFKDLVRAGAVSVSYFNYFKIYSFYKTLGYMPKKMDRYQFTAESFKVDSLTVQRAVKEMEKNV